jgi:hypothetical protein
MMMTSRDLGGNDGPNLAALGESPGSSGKLREGPLLGESPLGPSNGMFLQPIDVTQMPRRLASSGAHTPGPSYH